VKITKTPLDGLLVLEPDYFYDPRGWFVESWNKNRLVELGIHVDFVQDNHSGSVKNTLRGLHFQTAPGQSKLVRCTSGLIWDVAVDIRQNSPTFKQWFGIELSAENHKQLFIPLGFAHGFCVLSDWAEVQYKCSSYYDPEKETGIAWNDPDIAIEWPIHEPLISERDVNNPSFDAKFKWIF
jgi:dTDP-4-dehydrorhamnose 3,5-epimerase